MKILIINGPNLNMLGTREPAVYGTESLEDIMSAAQSHAVDLGVDLTHSQSNSEGELVTSIQGARGSVDGIVINPAAYTHTSVALRDALLACDVPSVEVHLSNTATREEFRTTSMTAPATIAQIIGFGGLGYRLALDGLVDYLKKQGG